MNAGNRFRYFLTEISSNGFLVIASGVMAPTTMEVGPQENPAVPPRGNLLPAPCQTSPTRLADYARATHGSYRLGRQGEFAQG